MYWHYLNLRNSKLLALSSSNSRDGVLLRIISLRADTGAGGFLSHDVDEHGAKVRAWDFEEEEESTETEEACSL